jgi:hypothetical protein
VAALSRLRSSTAVSVPARRGRSDLALTPAILGRVLELPVLAEAKLIERGVRLPAGVSVGMVCTAP